MSLRRFAALWTHPDYPPEPVEAEALDAAEKRLAFRLPESYREAVLSDGLPRPTIALLHSIVEQDLGLADISDFLSPAEIVEQTVSAREMGLPDALVAFATDCSDNLFTFDADGAVWFFDHDLESVRSVAGSFAAWIVGYCEIPFVAPADEAQDSGLA